MENKKSSKIIITLGFLGLAGCIFSLVKLEKIPTLEFKFPINKEIVLSKAGQFLNSQGISFGEFSQISQVNSDQKNIIYLQKALGVEKVNGLLTSLPLYYWQINYVPVSLMHKRSLHQIKRVLINPINGKVAGFSQFIPPKDYQNLKILPKKEIDKIAVDFFKSIGFDIAQFKSGNFSAIKTRYKFQWEKPVLGLRTAKLKVVLYIFGDKVGSFAYFLEIPPNELKRFLLRKNILENALPLILNIFVIALWIYVLIISIKKRRQLEWKFGLPFALLALLASLIGFYGVAYYKGVLFLIKLLIHFFSVVVGFLMTMAVCSIAKSLAKESNIEVFPVKMPYSILLSYIFTFTGFGLTLSSFVFVQKIFHPVSTLGFYSFFSQFPQIKIACFMPPLLALSAAVSEELFFRAFLISFINKYLKKISLAIILSSFAWSFLHISPAGYNDVYPAFIKGFLLLPIGVLFGYIFIKFGLVCAVVTHYLYDLLVIGMAYLEFNNYKFLNENIAVLLVSASMPLLVAFAVKIKYKQNVKYQINYTI